MEAASNQAAKQPQNVNGPRFGAGIDPREAGRRGGVASGISRRLRKQRELEAGIVESRNGAAKWKLLELEARRTRELEAARIAADRDVMRLAEEADREREEIERLRDRRREILERIGEFSRREAALKAAVAASSDQLVDRMRELHETGGLVPALVALDLFDAVDDEPSEVTS